MNTLSLKYHKTEDVCAEMGWSKINGHVNDFMKIHERSIDWNTINKITEEFNKGNYNKELLINLLEIIYARAKEISKEQRQPLREFLFFNISLVGGATTVSLRVAPSIDTGSVKEKSFLNIGIHGGNPQKRLSLGQTGEKGGSPQWVAHGEYYWKEINKNQWKEIHNTIKEFNKEIEW